MRGGGCFFFSSRRRHTRWPRDWSSDVCSSDLGSTSLFAPPARRAGARGRERPGELRKGAELWRNVQRRSEAPTGPAPLRRRREPTLQSPHWLAPVTGGVSPGALGEGGTTVLPAPRPRLHPHPVGSLFRS